ncbi:hypothetical protein J1N35_044585 [Gossypium stocksii]|uniref:Amino acid transporter transmembrane domain-containing protein n=1 Tax=Gossypium stocksii TaxID=47602 RepID=A0A9D3U9B4_9ROSI|nr:hypothetical protein J1N35_044585 [Gossypium stocksii]
MGEEEEDNQLSPLLPSSSTSAVKRTGTVWTAVAHIITGVIGAGVLSLAWSTAQLGWIAGPISVLVFAATTLVSTYILCDCYMYPHPHYGPSRLRSYMDAVLFYLGEKNHKACGVILMETLYGSTLAYVITSASSIKYDSILTLYYSLINLFTFNIIVLQNYKVSHNMFLTIASSRCQLGLGDSIYTHHVTQILVYMPSTGVFSSFLFKFFHIFGGPLEACISKLIFIYTSDMGVGFVCV